MVSAAGGGGGGSSFFAADPAQVRSAGHTLWAEAGAVNAARTYEPLAGLVEASAVEDAAAVFRSAWDGPLTTWQDSLASLGDAATESASAITDTDSSASAAWTSLLGGMG